MLFGYLKFWHSSYHSRHHKPFFFNQEVWLRISTWFRRFQVFRSDTYLVSEERRPDFSWYRLESIPQFEWTLDWVILFCTRRKQDFFFFFPQKSDDWTNRIVQYPKKYLLLLSKGPPEIRPKSYWAIHGRTKKSELQKSSWPKAHKEKKKS